MVNHILILTVGQGNLDKLEATLFAPLRKSIAKGKWNHVILLPSKETEPLAVQLAANEPVFRIETLPSPGDEDDADLCFAHFESVLSGLIRSGVGPAEITIDFTRGTKAMSAAIVLAAVTCNVQNLRYVTGKRDRDGLVIAGKEEVRDLLSTIATTRRELGQARQFLQRFQYTAAAALFPQERNRWLLKYPASCRADIEWTLWAARFWGAWDRFDYKAARSQLDSVPSSHSSALESWRCAKPQAKFLTRLAAGTSSGGNAARDLAADLLANASRRLASGAYEDTLLRSYRALEMVGQARLFDRGLDSENLNRHNPEVQRWLAVEGRSANKLDRGRACSLLQFLGDSFAVELTKAGRAGAWDRNRSLLLHGFRAEADRAKTQLTLDRVSCVFKEEKSGNAERLESARFSESES
jgi:CRISPR-associated protein (TIGR02710 family)